MSMELMVRVLKIKTGNPLRKLVLLKLADNASDQGECWPSYQHIADQCEISKRSVIAHISALCESGILKKIARKGGYKGNSSNLYRINLGGAGDSLGVVQEIHPPGAGDSPPPGAGDSPRTNHSLEPVNEPSLVSTDVKTPVRKLKPFYIREIWIQYPEHRRGGTDQQLWKKWKAMRLTESDAIAILAWLAKANEIWSRDSRFVPGLTKFIDEMRWRGPLPDVSAPAGAASIDWDDTSWAKDLGGM